MATRPRSLGSDIRPWPLGQGHSAAVFGLVYGHSAMVTRQRYSAMATRPRSLSDGIRPRVWPLGRGIRPWPLDQGHSAAVFDHGHSAIVTRRWYSASTMVTRRTHIRYSDSSYSDSPTDSSYLRFGLLICGIRIRSTLPRYSVILFRLGPYFLWYSSTAFTRGSHPLSYLPRWSSAH